MITIDNADIGYTVDKPILKRVYESIANDDRIALLGANGNGKSTLMKLIADKLSPLSGEVFRSAKLKIGYFSQHQTEELDVNSTPYKEMMSLMSKSLPNITEPKVRAKLGAFGFSRNLADNTIQSLSGGEKARLLFAFMSFDAPHLLLLDEPTNHLDIDAREALVHALNNYEGAIVIVSHDPNMVERVADRLWVVRDGKCQNFNGDLQDYRDYTIQARRDEKKQEKKKKEKNLAKTETQETKSSISPNALAKLEEKIATLDAEKNQLEMLMASPEFYTKSHSEIAKIQDKHAKLVTELTTIEAEWLAGQ
jgi:ATP-binding cassette subfamily F protein 3